MKNVKQNAKQQPKSNKTIWAGLFFGGLVLGLNIWLSRPLWKKIPFLRIVFPTETVAIESSSAISMPPQPSSNPDAEQLLVQRLMAYQMPPGREILPPAQETWQVVRMKVTAYCRCPKCCGQFSDGKTACLHRIRKGDVFVAADKKWPFGTQMIIPGYNQNQPVEVKDRGRLIKGNRLDVYFDNHSQAKKWGSRTIDVLVKKPNSSNK